jgi:hypothetical protein
MIGLGKSVKNLIIDRLVEDIDLGSSELASTDTLLEQNTQLGKGTAIGLGEAEVGVDDAQEADTTLRNQLVYNLQRLYSWYSPRRNQCSCSSPKQ